MQCYAHFTYIAMYICTKFISCLYLLLRNANTAKSDLRTLAGCTS